MSQLGRICDVAAPTLLPQFDVPDVQATAARTEQRERRRRGVRRVGVRVDRGDSRKCKRRRKETQRDASWRFGPPLRAYSAVVQAPGYAAPGTPRPPGYAAPARPAPRGAQPPHAPPPGVRSPRTPRPGVRSGGGGERSGGGPAHSAFPVFGAFRRFSALFGAFRRFSRFSRGCPGRNKKRRPAVIGARP